MADIHVRPATPADATFLQEMLAVAADWRSGTPARSVATVLQDPSLAHYVAGWPRPGDVGVVGEYGILIGAAWWRFFSVEDPGYGFVSAEIPEVSIGVRERWRGAGIGEQLMRLLIAQARVEHLSALSLSVETDNYAVRLYRRLGFETVDQRAGALTMLLPLDGA